jgi:hypothetical protein
MRIVPFPAGPGADPDERWLAELEAALSGEAEGPTADGWRELRADVRAMAPAMDPAFHERLREELERRVVRPAWLRSRTALISGGLATALAVVVAVVLVTTPSRPGQSAQRGPAAARSTPASGRGAVESATSAPRAPFAAVGGEEGSPRAAAGTVSAAPGRVQQLAASITLSTTASGVQDAADGVARLAAADEGFVESSHVQIQQQGPSEAMLMLRVPSARLGAVLASIGRLAQVRAESQSLQDITDAYSAARQRLSDAEAERQALLRALAAATSEGQIASLRERLLQSRGTIAQAQSALHSISQRASTSEVEVSVLGDAPVRSEGLTLDRGLHDAGRVLVVAATVLLIAAAALAPLALVLLALAGLARAWRRRRREHALDAA